MEVLQSAVDDRSFHDMIDFAWLHTPGLTEPDFITSVAGGF